MVRASRSPHRWCVCYRPSPISDLPPQESDAITNQLHGAGGHLAGLPRALGQNRIECSRVVEIFANLLLHRRHEVEHHASKITFEITVALARVARLKFGN